MFSGITDDQQWPREEVSALGLWVKLTVLMILCRPVAGAFAGLQGQHYSQEFPYRSPCSIALLNCLAYFGDEAQPKTSGALPCYMLLPVSVTSSDPPFPYAYAYSSAKFHLY
jgi:hypothetical protein